MRCRTVRCTLWAIRRLSTMRPGSPILLLLQRSGFGLRAVRPLRAWTRAAVVTCRRQCSVRARGAGFALCAPATRSLMSTAQVDAASVYVRCRLPLVFASLLPSHSWNQLYVPISCRARFDMLICVFVAVWWCVIICSLCRSLLLRSVLAS